MTRIGLFFVQILLWLLNPIIRISNAIDSVRSSWVHRKMRAQPQSAFTKAVMENDVAFVRAMLETGQDVDTRLLDTPEFDIREGGAAHFAAKRHLLAPTALIVAAALGHIEMADVLLEFGADLYQKNGINTLGSTALHAAAWAGHREMTAFLIRRSGLESLRGTVFEDALITAASGGHSEIVVLLVENGAGINIRSAFDTLLTAAASSGDTATVIWLLENGADINQASTDGETPLMAAADCNRPEAARILITAGAELNARDDEGRTALWWAKRPEIQAVLKSAGATK